MGVEVIVRSALRTDAGRIADVLILSGREFLPFAQSPHSDDETRSWVASYLLRVENVLVALVSGEVVGVAATTRDAGFSWITQMYVDPAYVRNGIGSLLLEHSLKGLPRPVRLHAFEENLRARHFYERRGFVAIGYSDGSDNEERCPSVLYELPTNVAGRNDQSPESTLSAVTTHAGREPHSH